MGSINKPNVKNTDSRNADINCNYPNTPYLYGQLNTAASIVYPSGVNTSTARTVCNPASNAISVDVLKVPNSLIIKSSNKDDIAFDGSTQRILDLSEYITDPFYVHTDNNYTSREKEKLASLSNYELPVASPTVLGGVRVDDESIKISQDGVISAGIGNVAIGSKVLTLRANRWLNKTQTVDLDLDTGKRNIIDVYASCIKEWSECGVLGIEETSSSIVFTCDEVPENDLTFRVVSFKVEYDEGGLTPEQIEAINNITFSFVDNNLVVSFDDSILDIDFDINNKNLVVSNNIGEIDFNINNKNLEVTY